MLPPLADLRPQGFPVLQHEHIYRTSRVYESLGVDLGDYGLLQNDAERDCVWIVPPRARIHDETARQVRFAVTGWAVDESAKYRLNVDHAIPLSDHADYDELLEAVARVGAEEVYCTHGPEAFVDRLREAGFNARPLGRPGRPRLF